jgi:hypothetical protein
MAVVMSWQWPLWPVRVVRPFDPPAHPWEAGHRGVDLAAHFGTPVYAAGPGRVGFARDLAGRGVVTVVHGTLRTTYMPVRPSVHKGETVRSGTRLGVVEDVLGHCGQTPCLHWGLRQGVTYLDPLTLLGHGPVRLLPWWPSSTRRDITGRPPVSSSPDLTGSPENTGTDGGTARTDANGVSADLRSAATTSWSGGGLASAVLLAAVLSWARRSGPGMRLPIRLPKPLRRHVRVQLRGRQRGVPEDLLDTPQVRPALEKMRRGTVP